MAGRKLLVGGTHMGEVSQGLQSMEMMSYFFLATVFGNLEVWKVKK